MIRIHAALLIALWMLAGVAGAADTPPLRDGAGAVETAAQPSIENPVTGRAVATTEVFDGRSISILVRRTEPATVVYSEYAGPYWGVGPVLRRVRADMVNAQQDGATFVRFPTDPRGGTIVPAATLVGYFAKPGVSPGPSYAVEHWKPMLVATTTIRGPNTGTTALYPVMRTWAKEHGYSVVGPIIEVYEPTKPGATVDEQQTEIQIPVRPDVKPKKASIQSAPSNQTAQSAATVNPGESKQTGGVAKNQGMEADAVDAARQEDAEMAAGDARGSAHPSTLTAVVRGTHSDEPTFEALVVLGRYDEALAKAWPAGTHHGEAARRWLDQLDARVRALAVALSSQDNEAARDVKAIADALSEAIRNPSDEANDSGDSAAHATGVGRASFDQPKAREIIQFLDRLMVRVGQRSVGARQCLAELRRILVRVHRLLQEDEP